MPEPKKLYLVEMAKTKSEQRKTFPYNRLTFIEGGGLWGWKLVDPKDDLILISHKAFNDQVEAMTNAIKAFGKEVWSGRHRVQDKRDYALMLDIGAILQQNEHDKMSAKRGRHA